MFGAATMTMIVGMGRTSPATATIRPANQATSSALTLAAVSLRPGSVMVIKTVGRKTTQMKIKRNAVSYSPFAWVRRVCVCI